MPLLALVAVPAIAGLTLLGFRLLRIPPAGRPVAAGVFVATGMPLDALATLSWSLSFPNLPASSAGPFAAYMRWCNAIAVVAGIAAARA